MAKLKFGLIGPIGSIQRIKFQVFSVLLCVKYSVIFRFFTRCYSNHLMNFKIISVTLCDKLELIMLHSFLHIEVPKTGGILLAELSQLS